MNEKQAGHSAEESAAGFGHEGAGGCGHIPAGAVPIHEVLVLSVGDVLVRWRGAVVLVENLLAYLEVTRLGDRRFLGLLPITNACRIRSQIDFPIVL